MLNLFKTLLSRPYSVPILAALAALCALGLGYQITHHHALSPLEILREDSLDTGFDPGYWTALARDQPDLYQPALLYCIGHPAKPNCEALRRQAFTTSLEHSAVHPPPLEPAAVPAQATPNAATAATPADAARPR
jgi:hypothetical protein